MPTKTAPATRRPYRVTTWSAGFRDVGSFAIFAEALAAFAACPDHRTKQIINDDLADGRDGLTEDERDQVAAVAYAEEKAS